MIMNTNIFNTNIFVVYFLLLNIFYAQLGNAGSILQLDYLQQTLKDCKFDKIYQLGDSYSDTGNLIRELPNGASNACSRLPYGQDFHHHPTGRSSNGLLMIDFIALAAGLPFLNPYKNVNANFTHGVNFAVAGSTALSSNSLEARNIMPSPQTNSSLDVQLQWMSTYFNSICLNKIDCAVKNRNALFFVGEIGGNDYFFAYQSGLSTEDMKPLVLEIVQAIKNAARSIIRHGGVSLVIPGDFPSGCFPCYLSEYQSDDKFAYDDNHCLKDRNDLSQHHNHLLQQAIKDLKQEFPNVTIIYGDYHNAFLWLFQNSNKLGFEEESKQMACCGIGGKYNYDASRMCGDAEAKVCDDPDTRISWDGIHLTQASYMNMAQWLLTDIIPQLHCSPFNSLATSIS